MKRLLLLLAATLAFSAVLTPLQAHALDVPLTKPGVGYIGQVGWTPYIVVVPYDGSKCEFKTLGTGFSSNAPGLRQDVRIVGTTSNDWITFASQPMSTGASCPLNANVTLSPLSQNGFGVEINGNNGDDVIFGGYHWTNFVNGWYGSDHIAVAKDSYAEGHGWDGADTLIAPSHHEVSMWGHWETDLFCVPPATFGYVNGGGAEQDVLCADQDINQFISHVHIEQFNNAWCGNCP
jgi:hypothetical protein